ncbi:MAG: DUF4422 domain-containing protein [Bacteroidota bacterium]|nr:DUF4422 domain-containing protein [Bacteroidota bacterium]
MDNQNNQDIQIYVAYHIKSEFLTQDPVYLPLHVGKALSLVDLGFRGDNEGVHISDKNKTFCETTGLYWMWKNTSPKIIGLSHYRRYFQNDDLSLCQTIRQKMFYLIGTGYKRHGIHYVRNFKKGSELILKGDQIRSLMQEQGYDIILPIERILKRNIMEQYAIRRPKNDLLIVREIIAEQLPGYLEAFDKVMQGRTIYACNMFVMKKESFDRYMTWLFQILFELEKRVDITGYSEYHQRIYGFIAERLLKVWLSGENLRIKELPTLYFKKLF